jgi:hypothetical protein
VGSYPFPAGIPQKNGFHSGTYLPGQSLLKKLQRRCNDL